MTAGAERLYDLSGKRALVTGSSRGIGFAIARGLGEAGAGIVLNGRDATHLQEAANALGGDGCNVEVLNFDVADTRAAREAISRAGPIDILVNNAGIQRRHPIESFPEADLRAVIDVNLTAPLLLTQSVIPNMIARGSGKIINICSVTSEFGQVNIVPYAAAKGGLKMVTRGLAAELGRHNIQVNGLAPGYIQTDLNRVLWTDEEFDRRIRTRTPAGRWGESRDLVGAAVFLASRASDYVNGHILVVDGGLTASV